MITGDTGDHMLEVVALLLVFVMSVALALGAAFVVLGVLLEFMRRTAVRRSAGSTFIGESTADAPIQRVPQYPLANHDGAALLVTRGAA